MRKDAILLEETRLRNVETIQEYPSLRERHRVFPQIFEDRQHNKILDLAAGVGCAAQRIQANYPAELVCNDITPKCLAILNQAGLRTVSFDLDDQNADFPFPDGSFDAVISLATLEHIINLDHHLLEIYRILDDGGYLYISSPNYAALVHLPAYLLSGRSFHNPLEADSRYEFYAHVRYFTFRTLLEFVQSFHFIPDTVYLPLPAGSAYYQQLYTSSRFKALTFRYGMFSIYHLLSPRWASEPIICFQKTTHRLNRNLKKVVL